MQKLLKGIVDFRERLLPEYRPRLEALALGQAPDTLFITCSDMVRQRLAAGALQLNGWWFDIGKGEMQAYRRARRRFEVIDRNSLDELLAPGEL